MKTKLVKLTLGALLLFGLPVIVFTQRYQISDWWSLRQYAPPAEVSSLAAATTMTPYGQRLFYVYKPELDDKVTFRSRCTSAEQTIVLGCYRQNQGIYILKVSDSRLAGAMEVTAAHEMLHVAYDRLSASRKDQLHALLDDERARLTDERILKTIKTYETRDASSTYTEMHSIFGTEVRNLSSELEAYYSEYFLDRASLVALSEKYEQVFVDIRNKVDSYDADLSLRKKTIESLELTLSEQTSSIDTAKAQLEAYLAVDNRNAYNNLVPIYNEKVRTYNQTLTQLQAEVETYNQLVAERNELSVEQQDLIETLETAPKTAEQ